jgi:hypothetical protein
LRAAGAFENAPLQLARPAPAEVQPQTLKEAEMTNMLEVAAEANAAIEGLEKATALAARRTGGGGLKLSRLDKGVLFFGEMVRGRPNGAGFLVLPDGACHQGTFINGMAHGPGVYTTAQGTVATGTWQANKRVGEFTILDAKGAEFAERYDSAGKKTARKKVGQAAAPALECKCGARFHASANHPYGCRSHKAAWILDRTNTGPEEVGIWSCCGTKEKADPGCDFKPHVEIEHPTVAPAEPTA